jgi:F0F1-type ATP synthase membrane subunit b/b'
MIRSLVILEWTIIAILVVLLVTQLVVPTIHGTPLLPLLRKRGREIENKIAAAREEAEIAGKRTELNNLKQPRKPSTIRQ